ncbi:hypothetical protein BHE74_00029155 [Ensete ventricosum]|nr:hypothetical protein GW17_00004517 [Ensete ventricosum]RWW63653.1 hypothetical protein BHE74_00029155 [Ensete ventricosum]RZS25954.1 hypothetical protein BHM03_00059233 [Ensete ventricosum]
MNGEEIGGRRRDRDILGGKKSSSPLLLDEDTVVTRRVRHYCRGRRASPTQCLGPGERPNRKDHLAQKVNCRATSHLGT